MAKYVIVGNGTAAAGCIEGIREIDRSGEITVISSEKYPAYCRPLISYYLEGRAKLEKMSYRPADFYDTMRCEVLYGKRAVSVDSEKKLVYTDDGGSLGYDYLCIASGSDPFVPNFEGIETVERRFSFMTIDDVLSIESAVNPESRVLIVGAGLIGLKCAEGLRDRVKSITVCDLAQRVLSSILDESCAGLMQSHLEKNGIRFMLGDTVQRFEGGTAHMKSGSDVEFDVLVLAVGVRPNISLIKDIGGKTGRGIIVDQSMKTSISDVFAAGDCTESYDISSGTNKVMAIMPNAYMQGHCAGVNMAGGSELFDKGLPLNSAGFFGLSAMTAGSCYDPADGGEMYEEKGCGTIKRFFTKDGVLTGFILIGDTERAGIYTSLIREKTPLDSVDFDLLKKTATSIAFSSQTRSKKFGGVV